MWGMAIYPLYVTYFIFASTVGPENTYIFKNGPRERTRQWNLLQQLYVKRKAKVEKAKCKWNPAYCWSFIINFLVKSCFCEGICVQSRHICKCQQRCLKQAYTLLSRSEKVVKSKRFVWGKLLTYLYIRYIYNMKFLVLNSRGNELAWIIHQGHCTIEAFQEQ